MNVATGEGRQPGLGGPGLGSRLSTGIEQIGLDIAVPVPCSVLRHIFTVSVFQRRRGGGHTGFAQFPLQGLADRIPDRRGQFCRVLGADETAPTVQGCVPQIVNLIGPPALGASRESRQVRGRIRGPTGQLVGPERATYAQPHSEIDHVLPKSRVFSRGHDVVDQVRAQVFFPILHGVISQPVGIVVLEWPRRKVPVSAARPSDDRAIGVV